MFTLTGTVLVILVIGAILSIFKIPHVVAYILAGMALGPFGLAVIENVSEVKKIEFIGVFLLLFFAGMKIPLTKLLANWKLAFSVTFVQIAFSICLVGTIGYFFAWTPIRILLFGFIISLSSTALVIKILDEWGQTNTKIGHSAVAILIAQDIAFIPMLMTVDLLQGEVRHGQEFILQIAGTIIVLGIISWIAYKEKVLLPFGEFFSKNHELQVFAALGLCFGLGLITELFHLSGAIGALLAGLIVGSATEINWVQKRLGPFYVFFVAIFFASVGMLVNPVFVWENIGIISVLVISCILTKTALNGILFYYFGLSRRDGFYCGSLISQVGEFGFVLVSVGIGGKIIFEFEFQMAISVISLTLLVSPLWINMVKTLNSKVSSKMAHD